MNIVTEKCYIGSTIGTLQKRITNHWAEAHTGSSTKFHQALREWDDPNFWFEVVLQNCYNEVELRKCEASWIIKTQAAEHGIGYNSKEESLAPRKCGFWSEERKEKARLASLERAKNFTPEQLQRIKEGAKAGGEKMRRKKAEKIL